VNNVRIITLYKLHNKLSCVSSASSHAVLQVLHGQNAWDRHVERVESCRVETRRAKWNLSQWERAAQRNPFRTARLVSSCVRQC